jgi:cyclopropane-fatty-acyl-phospholipid synthase
LAPVIATDQVHRRRDEGGGEIDYRRWPSLQAPKPAPLRSQVVRALLRRVAICCSLRLEFPDGTLLGPSDAPVLCVNDVDAVLARIGRHGKIGFGEAFMAGEWDSPDLVAVLEAMARHIWQVVPSPLLWGRRLSEQQPSNQEDNDRPGARRNIARHYDLSNDLFALFLDPTMTYSAAWFEHSGESLERAQRRKMDRLLDAVGIGPGGRVLEIGTGWGELAIQAARRGAQVTTVTLSSAQAEMARQRSLAAGLDSQIEVRVQDYRDVGGLYDAIVSVEMIEAVGEQWWPTYFRLLDDRLAPGGRVGLQAILMDHARMQATKRAWTWTRKYIFPGGLIPSASAIDEQLARHTTLRTFSRVHLGASYAQTLNAWRHNFDKNAKQVAALGFDQTFRRMWDFYLAQSEAGFRSGYLDVAQLILNR